MKKLAIAGLIIIGCASTLSAESVIAPDKLGHFAASFAGSFALDKGLHMGPKDGALLMLSIGNLKEIYDFTTGSGSMELGDLVANILGTSLYYLVAR